MLVVAALAARDGVRWRHVGEEGHGLTREQLDACDMLVRVPQYGNGTASLNVTVAGSIVLHHFALWSGIAERARDGAKYTLDAYDK